MQDFGLHEENTVFSCTATLTAENGAIVADYWRNRDFVTIRDVGGAEHNNMRVVIKKYGYVERFEQEYFWADFEFWGV